MNVMIETATGLRTPSGRDDERDPRPCAGLHIDRVVADAETSDDGEAAVWVDAVLREALREKYQRIEIRKLVGLHRIARLKIGKLDIRRLAQRLEVEVGIDGRSVWLAEIAGQGDAKRRAHRLLPAFFELLRCDAAFSQFVDCVLKRVVQHPDIAGVADEVEPLTEKIDPLLHCRDQAPKRLSMLASGIANASDRVSERLRAELSRHAERNRKVEMAHPQTVDSRKRGDGVGVLNALRGLDLAEERAAAVRGDELVHNGTGAIAIVRDLQGDAPPSIGRVFH